MHKLAKFPSPVSLRDICDQVRLNCKFARDLCHQHFTYHYHANSSLPSQLENDFENKGLLQALTEASFDGTLAQPRKYELAGAISRLRLSNLVTAGTDNTNKKVKY
jgi:hypothetical protein